MDLRIFALITIILGLTNADVVSFRDCPNFVGKCKVNEVRINPCPEAADNQPCKVKRGKSASIEFDFTPEFNADTVEGRAYWASEVDLPFVGMDNDGCKFTQCPIVANEKRTYNFAIPISRKYPLNTYDIKWRLTGKEPEQECCFITLIKLTR